MTTPEDHMQDLGPMSAWCKTCGKRWPCAAMTNPEATQVCAHCGGDIEVEDVVWANDDGLVIDGSPADPYHEECLP